MGDGQWRRKEAHMQPHDYDNFVDNIDRYPKILAALTQEIHDVLEGTPAWSTQGHVAVDAAFGALCAIVRYGMLTPQQLDLLESDPPEN